MNTSAVVLAVLPEPAELLQSDPALAELPFPVLADPQESTRQAYAGLMAESLVKDDDDLLFVLDQYGCPYGALVGDSPELHTATLQWLEYISVQCPE